jgi:glycosyltransferase involved in cell wall biosynthesis
LIAVQALEGGGKPIVVGVGENRNIDVCRSLYRLSKYNGLLSKITRFIAVSEIIKTKLTSLGISESKILLAPNGVDLAFFNSRGKHFCRSKYGIGEDDKVIAFVGRFTHDKGALRLVQAVDGIDNVKVMFIGSGPQELKSSAIVFKGSVPYTILPELLSCADIFALPTLHEGASNALIEAMAMGLPIISSDIPEIRLQCDPSCSILVDPMNIEELKAAIRSLVDNESMLRFMGDNARLKSLEFDLFQRASLIVKMFHQLF